MKIKVKIFIIIIICFLLSECFSTRVKYYDCSGYEKLGTYETTDEELERFGFTEKDIHHYNQAEFAINLYYPASRLMGKQKKQKRIAYIEVSNGKDLTFQTLGTNEYVELIMEIGIVSRYCKYGVVEFNNGYMDKEGIHHRIIERVPKRSRYFIPALMYVLSTNFDIEIVEKDND